MSLFRYFSLNDLLLETNSECRDNEERSNTLFDQTFTVIDKPQFQGLERLTVLQENGYALVVETRLFA
jgi:hypothetical protein